MTSGRDGPPRRRGRSRRCALPRQPHRRVRMADRAARSDRPGRSRQSLLVHVRGDSRARDPGDLHSREPGVASRARASRAIRVCPRGRRGAVPADRPGAHGRPWRRAVDGDGHRTRPARRRRHDRRHAGRDAASYDPRRHRRSPIRASGHCSCAARPMVRGRLRRRGIAPPPPLPRTAHGGPRTRASRQEPERDRRSSFAGSWLSAPARGRRRCSRSETCRPIPRC